MLRVTKLIGRKQDFAKYYCEKENYYYAQRDGVETILEDEPSAHGHMHVHGRLAEELGYVAGQSITQDQFLNLLAGKDKDGKQVTRDHKVLGFDLTFAAPKSVSVGALLTLKDRRIVEAHDRAVRETLAEFESHFVGTQPRAGEHVLTRNLVYGAVRDGFNREHDPHLHTHVVVANMTKHGDRIMALDGKVFLQRDVPLVLGGLYRAKLAKILVKDLGYDLTYTKRGEWRMDAVSLEVEENFSKRGRAIQQLVREQDMSNELAFQKTRKKKNPKISKEIEKARWAEEAARFREKTLEENRQEALEARDLWKGDARYSLEAQQELAGKRQTNEVGRWQLAARRATDKGAVVSAEAIITEYMKELGRTEQWEAPTYLELEQRLKAQVDAAHLVRTDDGRYTTWEMCRADREAVIGRAAASQLVLIREDAAWEIKAYQARKAKTNQRTLSKEQEEAAIGILASEKGLVVLQGDAGAGKTTMLRALHEVGERLGWEIVGTSVQGKTSTKLELESGIESHTLASYLARERSAARALERGKDRRGRRPELRNPRMVIVDEASMLGSRDVADLQAFATANKDKVVFVGDRHQLHSVAAGMPFERLVAAAEKSGELLSLTENRRQVNKVLKRVAELARDGRMPEALDALDRDNRIIEITDDKLRREAIAKQYDDTTLIMTASNQSRVFLNDHIRRRLLNEGALDRKSAREYELMIRDEEGITHKASGSFVLGEKVVFTVTDHRVYDVDNGNVGTITRLGDRELGVRLEDGREITIDLKQYAYLEYGYALTTYKGQGQTYEKGVAEGDMRLPGLHDQRSIYVWMTRNRLEFSIYTNDRPSLYEAAQVMSFKRDTLDMKIQLEAARSMDVRLREMAYEAVQVKSLAALTAAPGLFWAQRYMEETAAEYVRAVGVGPLELGPEMRELERADELVEERGFERRAASGEKERDASRGKEDRPSTPFEKSHLPGDPSRLRSPSGTPGRHRGQPTLEPGYPWSVSSFDSSITGKVKDFNTLFDEKVLEGPAEDLRRNLVRDRALFEDKGLPRRIAEEKAKESHLNDLDFRAQLIVYQVEHGHFSNDEARAEALQRLYNHAAQRHRLTGEKAREDVLEAHRALVASLSREFVAGLEKASAQVEKLPLEDRVRVTNKWFVAEASGAEIVLADMKAVEDRLNARTDLDLQEKRRIAALFAREAGDDLLSARGGPDLKIKAAEVALGLETAMEVSQGLSREEKADLRHCIQLAREAALEKTKEKKLEKDRTLDKDWGLEL